MNELLFGSVAPPWPAAPFPPMGWQPSSVSVVSRPVAAAASAGPASALGFNSGISALLPPPPTGIAAGGVTPVTGAPSLGGTVSSFPGAEVAVGVPVPVLLATVAIRRGQPMGPSNDQEIEDFIYDVLELLPGSGEVDVRCESGRITFSGTVHYKRLKRDVGEVAWAIPGVNDVQNNITIAARRRSRASTQSEPQGSAPRKSA